MASSLVAYAKLHGIKPSGLVENFTVLAGEGVSGVIDGHVVHIGNERFSKQRGWNEAEAVKGAVLESWRSQGCSISWIGLDGNLQGILCAGDPLRSEAQEAVRDLKKLGLQLVMLTGDSLAAANVVQKKLGEIEVHAQLLPQDKVKLLREMKAKIGCTGMVGDGINDASALSAADVGIAMGVAGSAVAMETADIALMTSNLKQLEAAVKLGQQARWKICQNILLSLATKLLIIALAAFGYASLWGAVLADVGTCLVVIFNSMLLLRRGDRRHQHCHGHHGQEHHVHHEDSPHHRCNDDGENSGHGHHSHHKHHSCNGGCEHDFPDTYGHKKNFDHGHPRHPETREQRKGKAHRLKLKLSSILRGYTTRKHGVHDVGCSNRHAESWKRACNSASNNDVRWGLSHKSMCAENVCSSTAMAKIAEGVTDTVCHRTDHRPYPCGKEGRMRYKHDLDLNLCAAYCAYDAVKDDEADVLSCASYGSSDSDKAGAVFVLSSSQST